MIYPSMRRLVSKDLERQEGMRLFPYRDTVGKLTIGIGRNLEDRGITRDEALTLLGNDVHDTIRTLERAMHNNYHISLGALPSQVQRALINMAFQLGVTGLMQFKKMLTAIAVGNYATAAKEALDSRWAEQTPNRAREVAGWIRTAGMTGGLMA